MRKLLTLIIFILFVSGAVQAQDTPATFCGTLSEADCSLITQSATAMQDVKSAAFQFQLNFDMSGIPDSTPGHVNFRMTGSGAYAFDADSLSALLLSPNELADNMDQLPQIMEDAIRAISADANFLIFFSDDWAAAMGDSSDINWPDKAGFSTRMVDGMAYVNLGKLAELDTKNELPQGWIGLDLATYYRQILDDQASALTGVSPLQDFDFAGAADFQKFLSIERIEDSTADGQTLAVFKTTFDIAAFYNSEEFQTMMQQFMEQSGGQELSQKDFEAGMEMIQSMLNGLTFEMTQSIGLDDHYTHQISLSVHWPLDVNAIAALSGSTTDVKQPPIDIQFSLQGNLSQFNNAPAITAPEDATIISPDDLDNFMSDFDIPTTSF